MTSGKITARSQRHKWMCGGATCLALLISAEAQAAPAWEVAENWRCHITTSSRCAQDEPCTREATEIVREIEFGNGEVWLVGLIPPRERFLKAPIRSREFDGGGTYFSTDLQLFLMLPVEDQIEEEDSFSVQIAALSVTGNSHLLFGICKPLD